MNAVVESAWSWVGGVEPEESPLERVQNEVPSTRRPAVRRSHRLEERVVDAVSDPGCGAGIQTTPGPSGGRVSSSRQ